MLLILNHVGRLLGLGPYAGKRDEVFEAWKQGISAVAECPNVVVKVGGLGNPQCPVECIKTPLQRFL